MAENTVTMLRTALMRSTLLALFCTLVCALWPWPAHAAELTPTEQRWLQGLWPVVAQVRAQQWPVDIVVQPQDAPGAAPLALGFVGGRCKLVLSMRANPQAQATLERIPPELLDAALGLMAAHEIHGHCRRHLDGAWRSAPPGVDAEPPAGLDADLRTAWIAMRATRREEAFADLAGLAWARQHQAALYPKLHAWLVAERGHELIEGSHHDTLAWLARAAPPAAETALRDPAALWREVLEAER